MHDQESLGLLPEELGELVQVGIGNIRNGAVFHPPKAPMKPVVPLPRSRRMNRRIRLFGG